MVSMDIYLFKAYGIPYGTPYGIPESISQHGIISINDKWIISPFLCWKKIIIREFEVKERGKLPVKIYFSHNKYNVSLTSKFINTVQWSNRIKWKEITHRSLIPKSAKEREMLC